MVLIEGTETTPAVNQDISACFISDRGKTGLMDRGHTTSDRWVIQADHCPLFFSAFPKCFWKRVCHLTSTPTEQQSVTEDKDPISHSVLFFLQTLLPGALETTLFERRTMCLILTPHRCSGPPLTFFHRHSTHYRTAKIQKAAVQAILPLPDSLVPLMSLSSSFSLPFTPPLSRSLGLRVFDQTAAINITSWPCAPHKEVRESGAVQRGV